MKVKIDFSFFFNDLCAIGFYLTTKTGVKAKQVTQEEPNSHYEQSKGFLTLLTHQLTNSSSSMTPLLSISRTFIAALNSSSSKGVPKSFLRIPHQQKSHFIFVRTAWKKSQSLQERHRRSHHNEKRPLQCSLLHLPSAHISQVRIRSLSLHTRALDSQKDSPDSISLQLLFPSQSLMALWIFMRRT